MLEVIGGLADIYTPVSRFRGDLRCGAARLSRTRRRSWVERDGGRDARRCTHGQERPPRWLVCCGNRYSVTLPDTRMSMTPSACDPAMRWIVAAKAVVGRAASPSQIGCFETQWLATDKNLFALADLSGQWIDLVHGR